MSVKENIIGIEDKIMIKKKGIFDLQRLYADIYKWFIEKGYEFHEMDHKYKATNPLGEEHELFIYGWRKENDFIKWDLWVRFMIWDLIPITVEIDGKKKQMYQGRIRANIEPFFIMDYNDRFEKTKFLRQLRSFYIKQVIFRKFLVEGDKFEYEFHELHELIKKDLDMYAHGNQFAHFWK